MHAHATAGHEQHKGQPQTVIASKGTEMLDRIIGAAMRQPSRF